MPTLNDLIKKREAEAEKAKKATEAQVRVLQALGYTAVIEWAIQNLDTEEGKFKATARNLGRVSGLYRVLGDWQTRYKGSMLGTVLDWAGRIFGANEAYFDSFEDITETITDKARRLTLQRWGYDGAKLIPGGYFESLFNNQSIAQRTASLVNQAINQKMSLKDFQKTFKSVFVGIPGQGMLERHWKTNSFDLYMRLDRQANLIYADELGLNNAIYSHTFEEDSRAWCIKHGNKVFSRSEIERWKDEDWQGKNKINYDPFTDCGGFNCRGHWSFISDGLAEVLSANSVKEGDGSALGIGGVSGKVFEDIKSAEDGIRWQSKESAVIFKDGKMVLFKDGNENSVVFSPEEAEATKGGVFTHNHPMGRSFSVQDLVMFEKWEYSELRAVSKGWTYSIKPAFKRWNIDVVHAEYGKVNKKIRDLFEDKILSNQITIDQAEATHHNEVMLLMSKTFGWDYSRTKYP